MCGGSIPSKGRYQKKRMASLAIVCQVFSGQTHHLYLLQGPQLNCLQCGKYLKNSMAMGIPFPYHVRCPKNVATKSQRTGKRNTRQPWDGSKGKATQKRGRVIQDTERIDR